jgi:molybdate transport system ATP-binding protein
VITLDGEVLDDTGRVRRARGAAGRAGLPELPAVPAPDRARQRRLLAALPSPRPARVTPDRRPTGWPVSASPSWPAASGPALSGGQAQRVALARALAGDPALLLLDEPLAALDARPASRSAPNCGGTCREFRGATLLVTHDPLEAMVMADRLLVIEDGRVVQHATPAEVARRPATDYVARLVGLNLYRGVLGDGGCVTLDDGGRIFVAASSAAGAVAAGARVLVAVRPNAIAVHTERPAHASPRNVWEGTVTGMELLGDRVRAQVSGSPSALVDLTPAAVAELHLVEGGRVWLSAKATDLDTYAEVG